MEKQIATGDVTLSGIDQETSNQETSNLETLSQETMSQETLSQKSSEQNSVSQVGADRDAPASDLVVQELSHREQANQELADQELVDQEQDEMASLSNETVPMGSESILPPSSLRPSNHSDSEVVASATHDEMQTAATADADVEILVELESEAAEKSLPHGERFADFGLLPGILTAIESSGYESPTAIQAQIIPLMLAGRDVLAQSQTGTGKTAAFALPILNQLQGSKNKPQVLVLTPTRELAIQVARSFSTYGAVLPDFSVLAIYGGSDYDQQFRQLKRGVQVIVGTPGRVIDHVNRGTLDLSEIQCLVLDEADEMLNMGFLEDVQFVLDRTPATRQVALFSATLPPPIRAIADRYLRSPAKITIRKKTLTADSIRQRAVFVAPRDKVDVLTRILEAEEADGVIVFTKTREASVNVAEQLSKAGLSAVALNGDMPQKLRERTIEQLKSGQLDILVATDVAARGLDVTRISHVFNFDLPQDSESYIHRVGRTGRAGRKGEAIIFLNKTQRGKLKMIEKATKQPIEVMQPPSVREINSLRVKRFKARIAAVAASEDLSTFTDLIQSLATESSLPMEQIAASLAFLGQEGKAFQIFERPRQKWEAVEADTRSSGEGSKRGGFRDKGGKRDDFGSGSKRFGRDASPRGEYRIGPPSEGMQRYRIEVGRRDGVRPGNIVGAVANEAGIDSDFIGPIKIHDQYSTIDLPTGLPSEVHQILQRTWVSGKQLKISDALESSDDSTPRFRKSFKGAKPHASKKRAFKGSERAFKSGGERSFKPGKATYAGKKGKRKSNAKPS